MNLGEKIKAIRMAKGLTGKELGIRSSTGQSTISEIERGIRSPNIDTLQRICDVLGIQISELFDEEESSPNLVRMRELFMQLNPHEQLAVIHLLETMLQNRLPK